MKSKVLIIGAAGAALALSLNACSSKAKTNTGGTSSTAAGSSSSSSSSSGAPAAGASVASQLILGGPPEFQTRVDGVPGLAKIYGVTFKSYKVLDTGGPVTVTALKNGQVDAADLFTTDPSIAANNFVILADPKSDFAAQNVLPIINKAKATDGVKKTLNAISAKLDTPGLAALMVKVITNKQDPDAVAKQWLADNKLDTTGTDAAGAKLTVGSANFPESTLLADIYADALKAQGASTSLKPNIGSREKYVPGLKDGSIDLMPEYNGSILQFLDKTATATSPTDVLAALQKVLPSNLIVLDQSAAQDSDAIVVTQATATKYNLKSIADLANPAK
ncbi:MAG: osmoprotectant transport system substrate-binding protein [Actinomycetota bacterium]|nr:osmoprotectant transport system substrate-binding protein [Actinomycetota bacterium]MDQ1540438.1 osmoprotectant transport system substrate-binding protein [Actinomycetota bacterium]